MPIRIGICDDTADDIELLKETLYAYDRTFEIVSYTDGKTLINDFLGDKNTFDILFLDIYMPGTDGIRTAEIIRRERTDISKYVPCASYNAVNMPYDSQLHFGPAYCRYLQGSGSVVITS
ncbi:MAG TPA: response regulator [Clostridiaceae bacterium]|nr:response regulator [Clostridiaceae bacterium]